MALILEDKSLENQLIKLSKNMEIKAEDLLKQFVKERIEQININIDTSHIELVDNDEKNNILDTLNKTNKNDKVIDESFTKEFKI